MSTHNYNMGSQGKNQYTLNVNRNYKPVSGVWHSGVKFSANCKGIEGSKFQRHWTLSSDKHLWGEAGKCLFCLITVGSLRYSMIKDSGKGFLVQADCREYRESVLSVMPHRWVSGLLCTIVVACVVKKPMQDGIYVLHKSWLIWHRQFVQYTLFATVMVVRSLPLSLNTVLMGSMLE